MQARVHPERDPEPPDQVARRRSLADPFSAPFRLINWSLTDPAVVFLTGPLRLVFAARGDADLGNQRVWPR